MKIGTGEVKRTKFHIFICSLEIICNVLGAVVKQYEQVALLQNIGKPHFEDVI